MSKVEKRWGGIHSTNARAARAADFILSICGKRDVEKNAQKKKEVKT
jgi:hypothetical protein